MCFGVSRRGFTIPEIRAVRIFDHNAPPFTSCFSRNRSMLSLRNKKRPSTLIYGRRLPLFSCSTFLTLNPIYSAASRVFMYCGGLVLIPLAPPFTLHVFLHMPVNVHIHLIFKIPVGKRGKKRGQVRGGPKQKNA
jgi:hypothetical protein